MKVSYLHIRNYKQFLDLELDLTYPKGHEKAGKPLDKICIIGQSGTGKTNLLDIIKKSTVDFSEQPKNSYLPFSEFVGKDTDDKYIATKFELSNEKNVETLFTVSQSNIHGKLLNAKQINTSQTATLPLYEEIHFSNNEKIYFVSAVKDLDIKTNTIDFDKQIPEEDKKRIDAATAKINDLLIQAGGDYTRYEMELDILSSTIESIKNKYKKTLIADTLKNIKKKNFIDRYIININESNNYWKLLKERIDNYEREKTEYTKKLSKKLLNDDSYSKEDYKKDMALWEEENENILEKIADDINSIIKKFNLQLEIDEYTQSYEELKIKDLANKEIIDYDSLSTGTKNLLSTFIPLKSYKPKDSIILIDEPEMSFYPDIQRQLVELYTIVGKNNQLIVATHSPLIASSFEPWEVVELKFDKNNQIYREKYYEGENHVDNYTVDPRMLTWTGILTDIFDIEDDSNFSFREKKLMEYATLKSEIKQMQSQDEKVKAFEKLKKVSKILGIYN